MQHESFQLYIDRPEEQQRLYKRILKILMLAQIFGGAGLGAGITGWCTACTGYAWLK